MRKNSGYLVITKSGKKGRTKHSDSMIGGKQPVYIEENMKLTGEKILCAPDTLKIRGFID